ncbi:MAG: DUF6318 family protein [Actinomycetes bacterium]
MRFVPGGAARFAGAKTVLVACLLAIGSAGGLAGCTGDPAPIVTETPTLPPSPTETSSPSPSPSATALTDEELLALMPEEAARDDLFGAMATAQFFLEQYAPMFHTGDTRVWEALSAPECTYCADALENAERVRDEGWTATGGEIVVNEAQTQGALTAELAATVVIEASLERAVLVDAIGDETVAGEQRRVDYGLELAFVAERWSVLSVVSESP